jgi:hypothetical protein
MKHILNNLTEEEKNSIREQHTGGKKIMIENFNKLINSTLGNSKPLMEQKDNEPKNKMVWDKLVSKLKTIKYQPYIITSNKDNYGNDYLQSLNWGLNSPKNKSTESNYGLSVVSDKDYMVLTSQDTNKLSDLFNWWKKRGYNVNPSYSHTVCDIYIDLNDTDRIKNDISEFFNLYPPN